MSVALGEFAAPCTARDFPAGSELGLYLVVEGLRWVETQEGLRGRGDVGVSLRNGTITGKFETCSPERSGIR